MNGTNREDDVEQLNQRSLNILVRTIQLSEGEFTLILAHCNYASLRDRLVKQLQSLFPIPIHIITLPVNTKTLFTEIHKAIEKSWQGAESREPEIGHPFPPPSPSSRSPLFPPPPFLPSSPFFPLPPFLPSSPSPPPAALFIFGLESVLHLDQILLSTNQIRDEFPKHLSFPLVLWVNDWVLLRLSQLAPDFKSWASVVHFDLEIADLIASLQDHTNRLFSSILDYGDERFPPNWAAAPPANSLRRTELEFALNRINESRQPLSPSLHASFDFLLGQEAHGQGQLVTAREYYNCSLQFWRSRIGSQELEDVHPVPQAPHPTPAPTPTPPLYPPTPYTHHPAPYTERAACVLVYLGLSWRAEAVLQRVIYKPACWSARDYFRQSRKLFEQINRQDLVAKFIIVEMEVLQKLEQWSELETLAKKALVLHNLYKDPIRLARDYGFLAEVAITYSNWAEAKQQVETAQRILHQTEEIIADQDHPNPHLEASLEIAQRYHSGWYLLLLAITEAKLGQPASAIAHLETARKNTYPQTDPPLYIQILETLRKLYFVEKRYLDAFHTRRLQRSLEHQYGFRAFVGALQLAPQHSLINALPDSITPEALLAQEIAASGRQQDVERLLVRLHRIDFKLTIIHGPSGVGKSSIINAGLVPALQDKAISGRIPLPIVCDRYIDWQTTLETSLNQALGIQEKPQAPTSPSPPTSPPSPSSPFLLFPLLLQATTQYCLPILIFDQFEEFFFTCDTIPKRRPFYEFLRDCLNQQDYVKVILSLREDYLHYLLEFQRFVIVTAPTQTHMDSILDILGRTVRYPLNDFTPAEATSVIRSLSNRANFYLEDRLIDALVQDLAGDLGQVRPIELQVVGAQLQTEGITTLEQYQRSGTKETLVERYLESNVQDCGPETEDIARLVLFLLTSENGTRPLKTRTELEIELADLGTPTTPKQLDLVLEVLVGSGLVFFIPEAPTDLYQLVHDYLVSFIQKQYKPNLATDLKQKQHTPAEEKLSLELAQRLKTEKQLTQTLRSRLHWAVVGGLTLIGITLLAVNFWSQRN
jgi:tetratricopeptide (TPR) repeat protein